MPGARPLRRLGVAARAFGVGAFTAAVLVLGGGDLASCTDADSLAQPDDGGNYVPVEASHPPPSMYGSPCELEAEEPPELCCGSVAKRIQAKNCYGCTSKAAYALCQDGVFGCACTCEVPLGYSLLGPGNQPDCGVGSDAEAGEPARPDATHDATSDAASDVGD